MSNCVKVFLANGTAFILDDVSSTKKLCEGGKIVLLVSHFDDETNQEMISCFDLSKGDVVGYSISDEL
ncbi:hypothetical protein [Ligilactobacillus salivarius]|uniref:hypothetical protein n=1 Tax=Ligilactobacillus salivarius TaxID=1624 RepID=UPI001370A28D|nr:hypothetical protein [Ligilactobacillus salivarius]MYY56982.1 hypothetical protein [Ligilactobacillus salivarius]